MSQHAKLSPSDKTWPNCPGSVRVNADYPDIPGDAAIDGTGSHILLEACLVNGVKAADYVGEFIGLDHPDKPQGWMVDNARAERVQQCLDYVTRRVGELKKLYPDSKITVESESRSNPGSGLLIEDWWGTCDVTITVLNRHKACLYLEVIDYKDGVGRVSEIDNTQLLSYLFGKMAPFIGSGPHHCAPFSPQKIGATRQTIVQPKLNPTVRFFDASGEDVWNAHYERLVDAVYAALEPDAPLIPDKEGGKGYCRWCPHGRAGNCEALNNSRLEAANSEVIASGEGSKIFELTTMADIANMSDEQLGQLYDREPAVMQVFVHIKEELQRRVEQRDVPGFAMQPGRGSRIWVGSEEETVKALKTRTKNDGKRLGVDDIMPRTLISPAQCLKLDLPDSVKQRIEKDLIVFKTGDPKLTRVKHEKPKLTAEEMFGTTSSITFMEAPADAPNFMEAPADAPNFF